MSERKDAYDHRAEIQGARDAGEPSAETEHRDTASGNAEERNELMPEQRRTPPATGPRTHDDTRVARKSGA